MLTSAVCAGVEIAATVVSKTAAFIIDNVTGLLLFSLGGYLEAWRLVGQILGPWWVAAKGQVPSVVGRRRTGEKGSRT